MGSTAASTSIKIMPEIMGGELSTLGEYAAPIAILTGAIWGSVALGKKVISHRHDIID